MKTPNDDLHEARQTLYNEIVRILKLKEAGAVANYWIGLTVKVFSAFVAAVTASRHQPPPKPQNGGLVKPNENGPEIVNIPDGSTIIPHDIARDIVKGGGEININNVVLGNVSNIDEMLLKLQKFNKEGDE